MMRRRYGPSRHKTMLAILALYLVAVPFYAFRSGLPQPGHFLLFALLALKVTDPAGLRIPPPTSRMLFLMVCLSAYTIVVNGAFAFVYSDPSPLMGSLYFVYNTCLLAVVLSLLASSRASTFLTIRIGVTISVAVQCVLALGSIGSGPSRMTLFFNNPNQLGYFGLLCATTFTLVSRGQSAGALAHAVLMCGAAFLVASSMSRAAILSIVMLLALDFLLARARGKLVTATVVVVLLGSIAALGIEVTRIDPASDLLDRVWHRVMLVGSDSDDTLEARGYDRIAEHPELLVFGAGYGLVERFDSNRSEIHSTFGSVFFCYGTVGLALFCAVIFCAMRIGGLSSAVLCVPVMFYGLTHNGVRQTLFWLMVALLSVAGERDRHAAQDHA